MIDKFKGTGVAIITPFHKDGSVDYQGLEKLIEHLISNKIEYIVSCGTTGESVTLTQEEQTKILDFTVEKVNGRVPIVGGFGGNNTQQIINAIKSYHFKGIDAILSVSPW